MSHINLFLHRVQVCIRRNRTNVLSADLIVGRFETAVTNQNCTSNFLIEHHAHLGFQPRNHVEIRNINYVITIHLLFLIDRSRRGRTFQQRENLFFLQIALNVTFRTSIVFGNICKDRFNARKRGVMNAIHDFLHPAHVTFDKLRRVVKRLRFREQIVNLIDAIFRRMSEKTIFQTAITLGIANNSIHSIVAKDILLLIILVKYIMFHFVSSFFIFVRNSSIFERLTDHGIYDCFLFFGKRVKHVSNGFLTFGFLVFVCHLSILLIIFCGFRRMNDYIFVISGIKFVHGIIVFIVTMCHNIVDICTRICSGENKTEFSNFPM